MKDTINEQLKLAMKAKNEVAVCTLRMVSAAFTNYEKANPGKTLDHIAVLQACAKQRRQSMLEYQAANQPALALREETELHIIEQFLPQQMSDADADQALVAILAEVKPESIKDLGKVIKAFGNQYPGLYDNKKLSEKIKLALA